MNNFKISVIIPIYNAEKYLEETIKSVINQTIGFKENIELILINDGSPDNSEAICLKYKELYPNNVIYYKQKNAGVSAARNKGIELATGVLTTMLDSDDTWSKTSFAAAYKAYEENKDIKLFSCKMLFFGKRKGAHPLNYKYKDNKIVNIIDDYDYPQLSSSSIFINTKLLKNYQYTLDIKYSEDNRFINEMILDEKKIMVLKEPTYYYRRREAGDSAIQSSSFKEDWYTITPSEVYKYLIDLSIKKYGHVLKYIQNIVTYELTWRVAVNQEYKMSSSVQKEYEKNIIYLLSNIDNEIILNQRFMSLSAIIYLLELKNNQKIKLTLSNNKVQILDKEFNIKKLEAIHIDQTYIRDNKIIFYGKLDRKLINPKDFKILSDGKLQKINYYDLTNDYNEKTFANEFLHDFIGINFEIELNSKKIEFKSKKETLIPLYRNNTILTSELPISYHVSNNKLITNQKGVITIEKNQLFKRLKYEIKNDVYLIKKHNFKALIARLSIKFRSLFKTKEIWLISDRIERADDNGEHFFKYLVKEQSKNKKIYFVLDPKSSDYERIGKIGKILDPKSNKYKLFFGCADYVVSSEADNYVFNPLGKGNECIRDQYHFKFIFLQHGIIKDDLSPWLNVNDKKMDMFVCSAQKEYDSLLECKYYYGQEVVKLTGLPRYDTLIEKSKEYQVQNTIMLSLTWRASLSANLDKETGVREYNPEFKKTNYFKFIDKLINDPKLLKILKENNYKIRFIPHPNVIPQLKDFKLNDFVEVEEKSVNYQKEFAQNKMLITDYSSVFFDFGYLKKPIIFYQEDREEFFAGQLYNEGYFDYEKNGFGPVYKNYNELINGIIDIIKKECQIEEKYLKRINNFFAFKDQENNKRVYENIKKLK